jgi:hypothetical protein
MNEENTNRLAMLAAIEGDITPGLPRVERAIAFVKTRGTATSSELHMVMELEPDELVSPHLASALADGRLIKDGKHWIPGVGPAKQEYVVPTFVPPQPVDNVVSLESQRTGRVSEVPKLDFAGFADMVNSQIDDTPACTAAPVIRCGLWSDGSVEVQRDGRTTAVLFVEEVAHLADFWKRVSANAKEAM